MKINKTKSWRVRQVIMLYDYSLHERRRMAYVQLQEDIGHKLFKILERCRNPAVVEIGDLKVKNLFNEYGYLAEEISIKVSVTPVEHRHVVIMHETWIPQRLGILERIKKFLRGKKYHDCN